MKFISAKDASFLAYVAYCVRAGVEPEWTFPLDDLSILSVGKAFYKNAMRQYGEKKTTGPHIRGHQNCGICHPAIKNAKHKMRRANHLALICEECGKRMTNNTCSWCED